jgi:hypothetical protein
MIRVFYIAIAFLFSCTALAQERQVAFGVLVEPIIPSSLFRISTDIKRVDDVLFTSTPKPGYAFGGILKFDYSERLSFETGINYLVRNYNMTAAENEDIMSLDFKEDSYEIPLTVKYFVRLGPQLYLSNSAGLSLLFIPGSIESKVQRGVEFDDDYMFFRQESLIKRTMVPAFKGGFGLQYRTNDHGSFYFETYYRLFSVYYDTRLSYFNATTNVDLINIGINSIGDYFGFSIRYTFPPSDLIRRKKKNE